MKAFSRYFPALALLMIGQVASPHHSFAMFDSEREMSLVGEIREFQWTNPHTWIHVAVTDAQGNAVVWKIEGASPTLLQRRGWTRRSLHQGDRVTIQIHPARDGSTSGSLMSVILADGKRLGE